MKTIHTRETTHVTNLELFCDTQKVTSIINKSRTRLSWVMRQQLNPYEWYFTSITLISDRSTVAACCSVLQCVAVCCSTRVTRMGDAAPVSPLGVILHEYHHQECHSSCIQITCMSKSDTQSLIQVSFIMHPDHSYQGHSWRVAIAIRHESLVNALTGDTRDVLHYTRCITLGEMYYTRRDVLHYAKCITLGEMYYTTRYSRCITLRNTSRKTLIRVMWMHDEWHLNEWLSITLIHLQYQPYEIRQECDVEPKLNTTSHMKKSRRGSAMKPQLKFANQYYYGVATRSRID